MINQCSDLPFVFGVAIDTLEREFDATYIGTCEPDYINHDERGDIWHRFECASGCDRIVKDSQLFQLANRCAS